MRPGEEITFSMGIPSEGAGEEPEGLQRPGDCNQDGGLDISDALCVFGVLFLGTPSRFPCGEGTASDEGNLALIDWQADGGLDLSDGVALLQFLFGGGPPHQLARPGMQPTACVPIAGCSENADCRN